MIRKKEQRIYLEKSENAISILSSFKIEKSWESSKQISARFLVAETKDEIKKSVLAH